jgi:hypothetical protein
MRYIRSMCTVEYPQGSPGPEDRITPAYVASNGDTWVINRYQEDEDGNPTGRTERVDQLTECQVVGDEGDPVLQVTGQSTMLAEMGVPEDDRTVIIRVTSNPRHR